MLFWPRALEGVAFSGLPAVAMAYLSEEMHPGSVGLAMGLYLGGTAVGGLSGRFITGVLTDLVGWRWAVSAVGCIGVIAAFVFWRSLPRSRHFHARPMRLGPLARSFGQHLCDAGLRLLFLEGFLLMGAFVTVYNYIGFRLIAPLYSLSHAAVGSVFAVYLVGTFSSAWVGDLAGRLGRRNVFWWVVVSMLAGLPITLLQPLALVVVGLAVFTSDSSARIRAQQLGGSARPPLQGASFVATPVFLLSGFERRGYGRRLLLEIARLARCRRVPGRSAQRSPSP
jgi:YNFM family putative membrane transporter